MGNEKDVEKVITDLPPAKSEKICKLVTKLQNMTQVDRFHYFQSLAASECDLISEIVLNFLKGRIQPDYKSFTLLKRCRKQLKVLASKNNSLKLKRKVLQSIQGLQIVSILFTLVKAFLSC